MRLKKSLLLLGTVSLLALTACGENSSEGNQQEAKRQALQSAKENISDSQEKLIYAIRTKPKEGANITLEPTYLYLEVKPGETISRTIRAINTGDTDANIQSIVSTTPSLEIDLEGGCNSSDVLAAGEICDINFKYTDADRRSLSTGILFITDARVNPQLNANIEIDVKAPDLTKLPSKNNGKSEPETGNESLGDETNPKDQALGIGDKDSTQANANQPSENTNGMSETTLGSQENGSEFKLNPNRPSEINTEYSLGNNNNPGKLKPEEYPTFAEMTPEEQQLVMFIDQARSARHSSGFGRVSANPNANQLHVSNIRSKFQNDAYDQELYPKSEASLPIDRQRILTTDRVITAALETPVTSIMCKKVVAKVDRSIASPDNTNILLPHYTTFIGHCDTFAENRGNIIWDRFILPDGTSGRIEANTADASGLGGAIGDRDNKYLQRYGPQLIFSSIGAILQGLLGDDDQVQTNLETGNTSETKTSASKAVDQFTNDLKTYGQSIVEEITDVESSLNIPAGSRIEISLGQDIYFKSRTQIVSLGEVEYELNPLKNLPVLNEQKPTEYDVTRTSYPRQETQKKTIVIDGKTYTLSEDEEANPFSASSQPSIRPENQNSQGQNS